MSPYVRDSRKGLSCLSLALSSTWTLNEKTASLWSGSGLPFADRESTNTLVLTPGCRTLRSTHVASATQPAAFLVALAGWDTAFGWAILRAHWCHNTTYTPHYSCTCVVKRESSNESPGIQTRVKSSKHCQLPSSGATLCRNVWGRHRRARKQSLSGETAVFKNRDPSELELDLRMSK